MLRLVRLLCVNKSKTKHKNSVPVRLFVTLSRPRNVLACPQEGCLFFLLLFTSFLLLLLLPRVGDFFFLDVSLCFFFYGILISLAKRTHTRKHVKRNDEVISLFAWIFTRFFFFFHGLLRSRRRRRGLATEPNCGLLRSSPGDGSARQKKPFSAQRERPLAQNETLFHQNLLPLFGFGCFFFFTSRLDKSKYPRRTGFLRQNKNRPRCRKSVNRRAKHRKKPK